MILGFRNLCDIYSHFDILGVFVNMYRNAGMYHDVTTAPEKRLPSLQSSFQFSILEVMNLYKFPQWLVAWRHKYVKVLLMYFYIASYVICIHMFHSKKRYQCDLHPQIQDSLWSPFPTSNSGPQLLHNILGDLENPKKRRVKKASAKGWTLLAGSHRNHRIFNRG